MPLTNLTNSSSLQNGKSRMILPFKRVVFRDRFTVRRGAHEGK